MFLSCAFNRYTHFNLVLKLWFLDSGDVKPGKSIKNPYFGNESTKHFFLYNKWLGKSKNDKKIQIETFYIYLMLKDVK